ncbi:MAG: succinate CoA transferase [Proteobacteria bacterium]|nr:succinate CoA transferase [Pseudomonadota bacterium]
MKIGKPYPVLTAEEATLQIQNGDTVAFSGFTSAGAAKAVPAALAVQAKEHHDSGRDFKIRVLTGASSSRAIDEDLAEADAISWRAPYQSAKPIRRHINRQKVEYVEMHLSHVPQAVSSGFFGKINVAVIEAREITQDGRVYLTTSIGASPTFLRCADKIIIEINRYHSPRLREMADVRMMPPPPRRYPIHIFEPMMRIGWPYALVNPEKVIGIVEHNEPDDAVDFAPPDSISHQIAEHVIDFLLNEMSTDHHPKSIFPLQAGVGNVANAVLSGLGEHPDIPPFYMYSEVFQDAMVDLMRQEKLIGASATSLTITQSKLEEIVGDMDFFAPRIVLRPQEFSNHPGIIRRLGVISLNTALEVDLYGNANSSHVFGTDVINGIGGSGEFTRNSYLSFLMTPSIAKEGRISSIVPMCPHVDNSEHSIQVVVTEQGLADLRGLGPTHRAEVLIDKCAHPKYRDYLRRYVRDSRTGHIRHDLVRCFELHRNLMETGSMLPE